MQHHRQPDRVVTEKVAGEKTKIRIWNSDSDYQARLEVERDDQWQFGIDRDSVATLLSTTADGTDLAADSSIPDWLNDSLAGLGIREVRSA